MFFLSLRRTFLTPVRLFGGILGFHSGGDRSYDRPGALVLCGLAPHGLLLADLLLAGDCLWLALAGTGVGLGALAAPSHAPPIPHPLAPPPPHLPPDSPP